MATTYTLIEAKTISTPITSITFAAIPQTYNDLKICVSARSSQNSTRENIILGLNTYNSDSGFNWVGFYNYSGTSLGSNKSPAAYRIIGDIPANANNSNIFSNSEIYIPNYSTTGTHISNGDGAVETIGTTNQFIGFNMVAFTGASIAITDVIINCGAGATYNFMAGSKFYLYGIKKQ